MTFVSTESYAHVAAKLVVSGWLQGAAIKAGRDNYAYHPIVGGWRVMPSGDDYGIVQEYPIAEDGEGIDAAWCNLGYERNPTAEELIAQGRRIAAVLDVAVIHKGYLFCGIEVVHKHDVTEAKAEKLRRLGLRSLVVLPSAWVLGQVSNPKRVPSEFVVW